MAGGEVIIDFQAILRQVTGNALLKALVAAEQNAADAAAVQPVLDALTSAIR
jgi:hypothetical protein